MFTMIIGEEGEYGRRLRKYLEHTGQVPSGCTVLRSRRLSGHRKRKQTVICWRKDSFTVCRKKDSCRRIFRQDVSLFPERKEKIVFAGIIRLMN